MNDKLPYEDELQKSLSDLPLPDEDRAWELMQQKLDEGNRRRFLPPLWLQNCAGWGLVLLLLGGAAWYFIGAGDERKKGEETAAAAPVVEKRPIGERHANPGSKNGVIAPGTTSINADRTGKERTVISSNPNNTTTATQIDQKRNDVHTQPPGVYKNDPLVVRKNKRNGNVQPKRVSERFHKTAARRNMDINQEGQHDTKQMKAAPQKERPLRSEPPNDSELPASTPKEVTAVPGAAIVPIAKNMDSSKTAQRDSVKKDSVAAAPSVDSTLEKVKKKKLYVSAGIGEQQQIPLGDQKSVPYDYYGRESSLSDYIPSVYVRLHKENKWFVQAEFRYGAPQSVKDFSYSEQTSYNSFSNQVTTRTVYLRKTYYHQLPLSFNYFVMPNWSVGAGAMYSQFYGAVTEEEIKNQDLLTQQETVTRKIVNIKSFNDSFLYKTQVHLLLQTDYHWKRFTIGLRYARDVQPYIKYTRPDGTILTEKNHSLQAFLRFRIWDSK